ncbi:hypothetical protein DACRYDRAFT_14369 [Dacryopinax primogenitus]|uniref:Uncharacterized protein n=1 Tax=Dacryopinax primogenitus (strain DJM 731) TaxID=1858805 RepID=M5G205_DACPD|nr:uncharacterized protein DACRYDRAFT_14369 [Dacryopinax primogenitus]EJU04216.1 hypothetical protein DACRYDRAFT_14369 [Dacryopinax primogenitus]
MPTAQYSPTTPGTYTYERGASTPVPSLPSTPRQPRTPSVYHPSHYPGVAASSSLSPLQSPRTPRYRPHPATPLYSEAPTRPPFNTRMDPPSSESQTWAAAAGKLLLRRLTRAAKGANWPLVVLFTSCLVVLFRALTGVGYVPPPPALSVEPLPEQQTQFNPPDTYQPSPDEVNTDYASSLPNKGWTHAWDVWRQVAEDMRREMMEDREKWVGSVRPERERGRGRGGKTLDFVGETGLPEELAMGMKFPASGPESELPPSTDDLQSTQGLDDAHRVVPNVEAPAQSSQPTLATSQSTDAQKPEDDKPPYPPRQEEHHFDEAATPSSET